MITFAILGHNESATIQNAVRQARTAAAPEDRVLAVDSGSDDDTAAKARQAGAEVLMAPAGKGLAMAAAAEAIDSPWICFLDADIASDTPNYAVALRTAIDRTRADHLIGEFTETSGSVLSNTYAVYEPLVAGLFPEAAGRFGSKPLTGFRAVRRRFLRPGEFPPDFGIEAHLNLSVMLAGGVHEVVPIGCYVGPFRYKPYMGKEIATAVLNLAERAGRLTPSRRPAWDTWVDEAVSIIARYRGTRDERPAFIRQLAELAGRQQPPALLDGTASG
jgi:glucosyl-3-phosphoglycerate synthase